MNEKLLVDQAHALYGMLNLREDDPEYQYKIDTIKQHLNSAYITGQQDTLPDWGTEALQDLKVKLDILLETK